MQDLVAENSVFHLHKNVYEDYKEYREDFKEIIREREHSRLMFFHRSPQISFRKSLVQYLKKVCVDKSLSHGSLHLSVYILDLFMDNHRINPDRLLLVANVCLRLAAKLEENVEKVPKISEMNSLINNKYLTADYINLEILIIKFFHFSIKFPCAVHYIFYYMQEFLTIKDLNGNNFRTLFYDMASVVRVYLDRIIEDVHYTQFYKPSKLAAAVIAATRVEAGLEKWTKQLEEFTGYSEHQLHDIVENLLKKNILHCSKCTPNTYEKMYFLFYLPRPLY